MFTQYEIDIIEKGIELSWTTWGKMRDEYLTVGDISYLKSDNNKGFERIFSVKLTGDNVESRLLSMISYMKEGIMPGSILITPNTRPTNLAEILVKNGFSIDTSGSCMMMNIDDYEYQNITDSNISAITVNSDEQLKTWLEIVNVALFGCEIVSFEQFTDVLKLDNTYFYLGIYNGKAVTACMTIISGDASVLEMVATLEEFRKKGVATITIYKALSDLKKMGAKSISLRAETVGINVYKRIGFKECFVRTVASLE